MKNTRVIIVAITSIAILFFVFKISFDQMNEIKNLKITFDQFKKTLTTRLYNYKPRYVFIDLGANKADSLRVFLKEPKTKYVYDYPKPDNMEYDDAEIFLFEANPLFNADLVKAKQEFIKRPKPVKIEVFPSNIVWTENVQMKFFIDIKNPQHG